MADIKTTTQELAVSGSIIPDTKKILESTDNEETLHETIKFLTKKIDELVDEVNTLKNQ
tara:strand:- start:1349 stop:1525 length:177 start_codon:yes stop_codon:yes gene_type:complete